MAVKAPGFDNAVGNRNRRVGRYLAAGDNRADRRHKVVAADTIAYTDTPTPDEITDSGDGLGIFQVNEVINSYGSTSNDGNDIVQTVAVGALGVDDAVTDEAASADIILTSLNNRVDRRH